MFYPEVLPPGNLYLEFSQMRKIDEEFEFGMNLFQSGNRDGAYQYFQAMLKRYQDNGYLWGVMGMVASSVGRIDEARECYKNSVLLDPKSDIWREQYAFSLVGLGKFEEVEKILEGINTIGSNVVRAQVREVAGLLKEAITFCEKAVEQASEVEEVVLDGRKLPPAYFDRKAKVIKAKCLRRMGEYQKGLDTLQGLAWSPELAHELGMLHDKLGNYAEAWGHFSEVNKQGLVYNRDKFKIKRELEKKVVRSNTGTLDCSRFIFIVGIPRSGTSLTEQILSMHPEVTAMGERKDLDKIANDLGAAWWPDLSVDQIDQIATIYTKGKHDGPVPEQGYVTDKLPGNWRHTGLIRQMFPGAKIIHCVRNPEDCLASCYMQMFHTIGTSWSNSVEGLKHYYEEWKNTEVDADVVVRYEELVSSPETEIPSLLESLGLSFHEGCLYPHKSDRHVATASYSQVKKPINTKSIGRGKNYAEFLSPIFQN